MFGEDKDMYSKGIEMLFSFVKLFFKILFYAIILIAACKYILHGDATFDVKNISKNSIKSYFRLQILHK